MKQQYEPQEGHQTGQHHSKHVLTHTTVPGNRIHRKLNNIFTVQSIYINITLIDKANNLNICTIGTCNMIMIKVSYNAVGHQTQGDKGFSLNTKTIMLHKHTLL